MKRNILATSITIIGIMVLIAKQLSASEFHRYYAFIIPYVLSNSALLLMLVVSFRTKVKEVNTNNLMFLICLAAANLPIFVSFFGATLSHPDPDLKVGMIASLLSLAAIPFYIPAVINLGRRISILPVASALETGGIYSFSRHPLYSTYIYWYVMQIFILQSWAILAISIIQIAFQVCRARAEEDILEKNFPEYRNYKEQVLWIGRNPLYKKTDGALIGAGRMPGRKSI